jgi:SAM-dependent methyltransferase
MSKAMAANTDGYIHSRNELEYARLREQGEMWRGASEALLDDIGLAPGMSCLDVGSGPGSVMRLMADRVGESGTVTGLEIDGSLGRQALADLNAEGGAAFHHVEADVLTTDSLAGAPFDLTYCRFFLMHMPDPVAILEKMHRWTKPGGVIAAQEFDFGSMTIEPVCPTMTEFFRLFEGVFRGHGRNMRAGRQLPAQFEAADLGVPDGTQAEVKFIPLSGMAAMLIGVYQGLFASAVELGIADDARAEAFKTEILEATADGRYYCLTPILVCAWRRLT